MIQPDVSLVQKDREHRLADRIQPTLSEAPALVRVASPDRCRVLFNDQDLRLVWTAGVGIGTVDLGRQVGFNRITCIIGARRIDYDFFTESARFTWCTIQEMALEIVDQIFRFSGQFVYGLPRGGLRRTVHSPNIEFGWIREYLPEIEGLVYAISRNPARQRVRRIVTSFRGGKPSIRHTSAYLRENPELLEPTLDGPILIGDRSYWPACIKLAIPSFDLAEMEHREIATFLTVLLRRCTILMGSLSGNPRANAVQFGRALKALLRVKIFARHRPHPASVPSPVPTALQRSDYRYRRLRELYSLYVRDYFVSDSVRQHMIRVNIADAWEIYQTYVAHRLGYAFGLSYLSANRSRRQRDSLGRSMTSSRFDLYYDIHPPPQLLQSWRDASDRVAAERPDILLYDRDLNRLALLEVKFRSVANGLQGNPDDLFEVQSYLNSFNLRAAGLIFPGTGPVGEIAGRGNLILEIPLAPSSANTRVETLRAIVSRVWQPCRLG
jgi:hypothetical protein